MKLQILLAIIILGLPNPSVALSKETISNWKNSANWAKRALLRIHILCTKLPKLAAVLIICGNILTYFFGLPNR